MAWAPARAKRRRVPREQCARSCVWWVLGLSPPPPSPPKSPDVCGWVPGTCIGPRPARSRVGVLLFTLYSYTAQFLNAAAVSPQTSVAFPSRVAIVGSAKPTTFCSADWMKLL